MNSETGHFEQLTNIVEHGTYGDLIEANRFMRSRPIATIATALTLLGVGMGDKAIGSTETGPAAESAAGLSQVGFDQYTHTEPREVLESLSDELLPKQGVVIESIKFTPFSLGVAGDCDSGSKWSLWLETASSLERETCDGAPATNTFQRENTNIEFRTTLSKSGNELVNDIPGLATDLKPNVKSISGSRYGITSEFNCPKPRSADAALSLKIIDTNAASDANVEFCNSKTHTTELSTPRKNLDYRKAINKYEKDSDRTRKWTGDNSNINLFLACPDMTKERNPNEALKYNQRKKNLVVKYDSTVGSSMCADVGEYTTESTTQIRTPSHQAHRISKKLLYISGLKEILVTGYGLSPKQLRNKQKISNTGNLCHNKNTQARTKFIFEFDPKRTQTVQHSYDGSSTHMRASKGKYTGEWHNICK